MTELEKMTSGELYNAGDAELVAARSKARQLFTQYNAASYDDKETKTALLKQLLGSFKGNIDIQSPFYCDYGFNIIAGDNLFLNFNCIILDCACVAFGDNVFLAPNVQLYTAYHPVIAAERIKGPEYAAPITIGNNVWLGGGVIVCPGVTIGDNTTIGAGSVVTKSIPANVVAAGNPCRVIREL
ncbi:sugar O-acetyltransferase [Mucilaginibacter gossypii]|uniref:sugar O-acetyltransferase n=1 Tax=Mucilaginibacter gossypii TaxID=551996 RepID=UPI000DCC7A2C|nr:MULTISPECIES: sugar O-acetyltransferase [Mucilaginibacter]QTE39379.1 sugar O-acetyltransferase [Mucilaginibacter gossypii]RAV56255.1 sugar O-acetyltransferase [Mucilaginibacter rubeus]